MTRGATRESRVLAALAAYALIKKRRETLAARAAFQLRLHVERLQRNALVAGVIIACVLQWQTMSGAPSSGPGAGGVAPQ